MDLGKVAATHYWAIAQPLARQGQGRHLGRSGLRAHKLIGLLGFKLGGDGEEIADSHCLDRTAVPVKSCPLIRNSTQDGSKCLSGVRKRILVISV